MSERIVLRVKKITLRRLLAALLVGVMLVSCVACASSSSKSDTESEEEAEAEDDKESAEVKDTEDPSVEESAAVSSDVVSSDDGSQLYICTAPNYVLLHNTPGGDDESDCTRIYAGTYLKWYGEEETVEKKRYLKVKVYDTGAEGWIEYLYAVKVGYDPDISVLDIVETTDPLYTYDMMCEDIDSLCERYPDVLHKNVIGQSVTGRDLYEITLGNPDAAHHVMVQATIHAREYVNTQLVMKLLEYYAHFYDEGSYENAAYSKLFDNTAFHVVTMVNPDGVTISQFGAVALNDPAISQTVHDAYERDKETLVYEMNSNGDMTWIDHYRDDDFVREDDPNASRMITFDEYQTIWKANANGVDLNNNFDAAWEDIDLKWEPSYGSFKGNSAVSEPEAKALADMASGRDFECYLSYHSTGQLIYYDCEGNSEAMSEKENEFAEFMQDKIHHRMSNNKTAYNVNLGGFGDWIQLSLNKPSLTIESGKKPCPLTSEEFTAIWLRHRESWAALANEYYNE